MKDNEYTKYRVKEKITIRLSNKSMINSITICTIK